MNKLTDKRANRGGMLFHMIRTGAQHDDLVKSALALILDEIHPGEHLGPKDGIEVTASIFRIATGDLLTAICATKEGDDDDIATVQGVANLMREYVEMIEKLMLEALVIGPGARAKEMKKGLDS